MRMIIKQIIFAVLVGLSLLGQATGMEYLNGEGPEENEKEIIKTKKEFKGFSFRGIKLGVLLEEQDVNVSTQHFKESLAGPDITYYWCENLPDIGVKSSAPYLHLLDGKVESIDMMFPSENAENLLFIMTEKYGKPSIDFSTVKNKMGAKFQKFEAFWKIKGCYIWLSSIGSRIDNGRLDIETIKYNKYRKEKERKEKQKAKNNL